MNSIYAIRHIFTLSEAVFITGEIIALGFLGCIKTTRGFQIDSKYRTFFGSFNLSLTIVCVFDNGNLTFLNLLGHINGGRSVALYGVKLSFRTDMIRGIIKQITFRGFDFLDRPIITANIIRSGELTVLISNIGIYKLIAFVNTVGCTCKRSITLCGTGFFIALSYGYIELLENIRKTLVCFLIPFNSRTLISGNDIADCSIYFLQSITGADKHILKGCNAFVVRNGKLINGKAADGSAIQVKLHALNKTVFGSLSNGEITTA